MTGIGLNHRSSFAFAPLLNREAAAGHRRRQPRQARWRLGLRRKAAQGLDDGSRTLSDSVLGLISCCVPAGVSESLHISLVFSLVRLDSRNYYPLVSIRLRAYAALVPSTSKDGFHVAQNRLLRGKESYPIKSSIDLNRLNQSWSVSQNRHGSSQFQNAPDRDGAFIRSLLIQDSQSPTTDPLSPFHGPFASLATPARSEIFRTPQPGPGADLAAQQKRSSHRLPARDSADQPQHPARHRSET
jgi:hypothetical protein